MLQAFQQPLWLARLGTTSHFAALIACGAPRCGEAHGITKGLS
jgi:hypothetical protein